MELLAPYAVFQMVSDQMQVALLAHGINTKSAVLTAALQQGWRLRMLTSSAQAVALLRERALSLLIYDWHCGDGNWHDLCRACTASGAAFQLLAMPPADDLFLAVAGAGGAGLIYKPLTPDQVVSCARFALSLGATLTTTGRETGRI